MMQMAWPKPARFASYNVLLGMLKLFAIYLPHITEEIYQAYFREFEGEKSIHLTQIEKLDVLEDKKVLSAGEEAVEVVSKIRAFKSENNLSLKEPLNLVEVVGYSGELEFFKEDLMAVGSIENLKFENGEREVKIQR